MTIVQNGRTNGLLDIEIFFVSAVIIIVLCNFFLLNTFSQENNTFARNYVRATRLVQERIKFMLDVEGEKNNKAIVIDHHTYNWKELFDESVIFPSCPELLDPTRNCGDFVLAKCPNETSPFEIYCIIRNNSYYTDESWAITKDIASFSQKIRISDAGSRIKKVTVFIWWYDSLGLRKSVITRELKYNHE